MSMRDVAERLGELADGIRTLHTRFDQVDARFDQVDARFDQVDARLDQVDARLDQVDARLDGVERRIDTQGLRLDSIDEKASLALEAHAVLRESMDRQFQAANEKWDTQIRLLQDVARKTSLRVGRLETRRKRR